MAAEKKRYISDLSPSTVVEDIFVLSSKEMRTSRAGKAYLVMTLSDKTGSITGYHFTPSAYEAEIPAGTPVAVQGVVGQYQETKKVTVEAMAPVSKITPAEFLMSSSRSREEMVDELRDLVAQIQEPSLAKILREIFGDKEFFEKFCVCPGGAQGEHHSYIGGLLEHTVSVAAMSVQAATRYPHIQEDILVCSAILHDIGQVEALEYDTTVRQSPKGRLLGHAALSCRRVREAAYSLGIKDSESTLVDLEHAIASHHGEEGGAYQRPATLEAIALHDFDTADAHMSGFVEAARGAARAGEEWTGSDNPFKRPLCIPQIA